MVEEDGGEARLKKWMSGYLVAVICRLSQEFFFSFPCNFGICVLNFGDIFSGFFDKKNPPGGKYL